MFGFNDVVGVKVFIYVKDDYLCVWELGIVVFIGI